MPPNTVVSVLELVTLLRADAELRSTLSQEKWQQLDALYAKYQVRFLFPAEQ